MTRHAAGPVALPEPGPPPDPPRALAAEPGPGRLRVVWADSGAPAYEVRWEGGARLVGAPATQIGGLVDGRSYRVRVRAVDAFGQRSDPVETTAAPGPGDTSWRAGLGVVDEFPDGAPGGRWRLSNGCAEVGGRAPGAAGLAIDLDCGAEEAVLRARAPLRVPEGEVPARLVTLSDAAGPGGRLVLDLAPGPRDRLGATPPPEGVRAVVDDQGARVLTGPGTEPVAPRVGRPGHASRRGVGVPHLFELRVTRGGVVVLQDGLPVPSAAVAPRWTRASVGLGGPRGRRARVHVATAAEPAPPVVEVPVEPATRQVLAPDTPAPHVGIPALPLSAARVVATLTAPPGLDTSAISVQLGDARLPAHPTTSGEVVTVVADVPPRLRGGAQAPFTIRTPTPSGARVLESYLEVVPTPGAPVPTPPRSNRVPPGRDALPVPALLLSDPAGVPLAGPEDGGVVLTAVLDGQAAQWDTGSIGGVQGVELHLDGAPVAGLPTSADGPGAGGRYVFPLTGLTRGGHVVELRVVGEDGARTSAVARFEVR